MKFNISIIDLKLQTNYFLDNKLTLNTDVINLKRPLAVNIMLINWVFFVKVDLGIVPALLKEA